MSINIRIQAKTEQILESEAAFYGVNATALGKAIIDKVVAGGIIRDVLQGVDVESYQARPRGRPASAGELPQKVGRPPKHVFDGAPVSLAAMSRRFGIPRSTLWLRISKGMSMEQAVRA